jgi:nucleotide-binding universal stress UspA family protein
MAMQERSLFQKIAVAYNESAESQRAFATAIRLAKTLGSELETITVMADLPSYTAFSSVGDPGLPQVLELDRQKFYGHLQEKARLAAKAQGLDLQTHAVEGKAVSAIVELLRERKADLLVIGLHQHDFYVARLWSTVYELAQEAPCSVLGVH